MADFVRTGSKHVNKKPYAGPKYTQAELTRLSIKLRNKEAPRVSVEQMHAELRKRTPNACATKIQAIQRGKLGRRKVENKKTELARTQEQNKLVMPSSLV